MISALRFVKGLSFWVRKWMLKEQHQRKEIGSITDSNVYFGYSLLKLMIAQDTASGGQQLVVGASGKV